MKITKLGEMLTDVDPEIVLLQPREQFDEALVGYVERCGQDPVACYDYEQTIEALLSDGMDKEGAEEWFQYNIINSWSGTRTPCFLFRCSLD